MSYIPKLDKDQLIKDLQRITLVKIVKQISMLALGAIVIHLTIHTNLIFSLAIGALTLYLYRVVYDIYGLLTLKKEMNKINIRSVDIDFNDNEEK